MTYNEEVLKLLERFVTAAEHMAMETGNQRIAVEDIAIAYQRQANCAEMGLELSRQHVAAQAQMIKTSESLEKSLEDKLIASMTPKKRGST